MSLVRNPHVFYGMGRRRVHRRRYGGSIFSGINDFLKKHQILSRAGNILGSLGVPYAGAVGTAARLAGYGKRRRRVGGRPLFGLGRRRVYRKRGGDLKSILSSAHKFIKDKRLVSSALRHFAPKSNLHKAAHSLGYGRRRRVGRPRLSYRKRGGDLKGILSSAHKFIKDKRLVSSALRHFAPKSNLHKAAHSLGYGRRRVGRPIHRHYGGANFFSTEQIAAPRF